MRIREFRYERPSSINETLGLLREYGNKARILAGGTDLLVRLKKKLLLPEVVIDLSKIKELHVIGEEDNGLHVGALISFSDLQAFLKLKRDYRVLYEAVSEIGSWQIRNIATLGGNICNASPGADSLPPLLTLDARVRLRGFNSDRTMEISEFFIGPGETALDPTEMLVEIIIPRPQFPCYGRYLKFSRRQKVDLALVGIALLLFPKGSTGVIEEARIALGAVAPKAVRSKKAERLLVKKRLDRSLYSSVAEACVEDSACISDVRGSKEFREELIRALVLKGLSEIQVSMNRESL